MSQRSCWSFVFAMMLLSVASGSLPASAETSDTVVVTGNITNIELSISIDEPTRQFGNINAAGTRQPADAMFARSIPAGFGDGAYWVMLDPITISVTSPVAWHGAVCIAESLHPPDRGLGMSFDAPGSLADAARVMTLPISADCHQPSAWISSAPIGASRWLPYLTTAVTDLDTSGPFSVSLRFSVSTGG